MSVFDTLARARNGQALFLDAQYRPVRPRGAAGLGKEVPHLHQRHGDRRKHGEHDRRHHRHDSLRTGLSLQQIGSQCQHLRAGVGCEFPDGSAAVVRPGGRPTVILTKLSAAPPVPVAPTGLTVTGLSGGVRLSSPARPTSMRAS
jgi:hypothetical protein